MTVDEFHYVHRYNYVRANDAHSIRRLFRVPTWTVLFVGRRVRTWGYLEKHFHATSESGTPVWYWTEFTQHRHNDEFLAALARRRANP